jgi:mRNA guanylyltransferase
MTIATDDVNENPGVLYTGEFLAACTAKYYALWGIAPLAHRNPCAQPVSLERKHIPALRSGNYVVADKSDGCRYTLFFCEEKGHNFSFLVDRKMCFYQIPVAASRRVFQGSIFDGELVTARTPQSGKSHVFLVFDVVAFRGSNAIHKQNLHKRLEVIRGAFDLNGRVVTSPDEATAIAKEGKIICGGNAHGLSFRPKMCFPMNQMDTLVRQTHLLPYATDGLIFTPVDEPVIVGTAERTYKLKDMHTVDLEVNSEELLLGQGGAPDTAVQRVPLAATGVRFQRDKQFEQALHEINTALSPEAERRHPLIVECRLDLGEANSVKLTYVRCRPDKCHPNTVRTMLATITNLRENIQISELCNQQRLGHAASAAEPPKPLIGRACDHGGAELANVVVGDVLDAHRCAGPFLTSMPA